MPCQDASNEYPQHMFLQRNKENLSKNYHQILLLNKSSASVLVFRVNMLKCQLTLTTTWDNSVYDKQIMFFLFFPENRIWNFMQIVSNRDNLHKMSNPVFWEKQEKKSISLPVKILPIVLNVNCLVTWYRVKINFIPQAGSLRQLLWYDWWLVVDPNSSGWHWIPWEQKIP